MQKLIKHDENSTPQKREKISYYKHKKTFHTEKRKHYNHSHNILDTH
jgi:hypothetical protein